jgi:L-seryl-tRNA(Ser) seleniumtransferase
LYRKLPSVSKLLDSESIQHFLVKYSRPFVVSSITDVLEGFRTQIEAGVLDEGRLEEKVQNLDTLVQNRIAAKLSPSLQPVINATGVVIYTNAGRSPIAKGVLDQVAEIVSGYTNLEYDLQQGRRGHRDLHFESRVKELLGCESATVCNNAAAALLLILNTLALGKKVLVSRGELIEIGGSFRLPAIMEKSGAILKEIGTTNKTKASDYREGIDSDTALLLKVHPSNYQIVGFTQQPSLEELVEIAKEAGLPLVYDVGSGYLFPTPHPFLATEPTVSDALAAGTDLICFSGDKLLGGPQAGLILGREEFVSKVRRNALMRALRVDKITYSALEWTLMHYAKGDYLHTLPIWRFMSQSAEEVRARAEVLVQGIAADDLEISLQEGFSVTGGGSAPQEQFPTWLMSVASSKWSPNQIEERLRRHVPPILCRIQDDQVLLDLRTVFPEQDAIIATAFNGLSG